MTKHSGRYLRSVTSNVTYLAGSQFMRVGARALYTIAIARYLGPESFGIYSYGLGWYLVFLPFTYLGLDLILSGRIARRPTESQELIRSTFIIRLIAALVAAVICALVGLLLEDSPVTEVLLLFAMALLARSLAVWGAYVFTAKNLSHRVFWQEGVCRVGEAVVGVVALLLGAGLIEVVVIHGAFWWLQALWALGELRARGLLRAGRIGRVTQVLGVLPLVLGAAGVFQVWTVQAPVVLFRWLGGQDAQLGQVGFALQLFAVLAGVAWAAVRGVMPALSRSVSSC